MWVVGQFCHYVQSFELQRKRPATFSINSNNEVDRRQLMMNQSLYTSRRKLKEQHKRWLSEYMDRTKGQHPTLSSLQRDIFNNFPDLGEAPKSTTGRASRSQVHFCFQKLEEIEQKTATADRIRAFFEAAAVIMK